MPGHAHYERPASMSEMRICPTSSVQRAEQHLLTPSSAVDLVRDKA